MSQAVTATSTITATYLTTNDGKISPLSAGKVMDAEGPSMATDDHSKALDTNHDPPPSGSQPSATDVPAPIEPTPVLERPRKDGTDGTAGQPQLLAGRTVAATSAAAPAQASHFSSNLISALKLDHLAASVARFDPKTGEKINRMRKSYENYLKVLPLSGKNKAIKHEEAIATGGAEKMMGLSEMTAWPEEEWQNQRVFGKDIAKGLPDSIKGKLDKAFSLNPGPVPEGPKWEDILGIERPTPNILNVRKDSKVNGQMVNGAATANANQNANAIPGGSDHIRARRNTKKRRYDDGSFEGYGEGYVDDEMENEGYESGDTYTSRNSRGSKGERKRRKTQDFGKGYAGVGSRTGSFASSYAR